VFLDERLQQGVPIAAQGLLLDEDAAEALGLVQDPGIHGFDEGIAADEVQLKGQDAGEIVSLLVASRVRRATNLCHELVADIDAGKMSNKIKEVDELYESLELACDRLRHLLKSRNPDRYVTSRI